MILEGIQGQSVEKQDVLKHVCILEANHFPGLNFNDWGSDDSKISAWTKINYSLLSVLIEFYRPTIVIGCVDVINELVKTYYVDSGEEYIENGELFNQLRKQSLKENECDKGWGKIVSNKIINRLIISSSNADVYPKKNGEKKITSGVKDEIGTVRLQLDHPASLYTIDFNNVVKLIRSLE